MTTAIERHTGLVDQVSAIAPPPKQWTALRERFDAFMAFGVTPLRDRLVAAIIDGGDDIATLRALAAGEADPMYRTDVVAAVKQTVSPRLQQIYAKAAPGAYSKVAAEFDSAASRFTATARECDPEAASADVVAESDETRTAWLDSTKHAADLDKLVPVLIAAAELVGIELPRRDTDTVLLPLLCDPGELHRRRVWEAWNHEGRCGRWSALVKLGATIRAWPADRLAEFAPYREPLPFDRRQFPIKGAGMYQTVFIDPEDPLERQEKVMSDARAGVRTVSR